MLCMSEKSSNFAVQIVYGSRNHMKAYCFAICIEVRSDVHVRPCKEMLIGGSPPSIVGIEVRKGKVEKTPVLPLHRICRRLCNNV